LNLIQFTDSVPNPRTRTEFSPRLDYQVTQNNTLTVRYQYERNNEQNGGIGLFSLPSLATNNFETEHQIQATDTQIINTKVINETRFRFVRNEYRVTPQDFTPTINVNGAFTGGGSSGGNTDEVQDQFEVQNYTSMIFGKHFLKLGGRLRATKDVLSENAGFNGSFVFSRPTSQDCAASTVPNCTSLTGLQVYQIVQQGIANGMTAAQVRATTGL